MNLVHTFAEINWLDPFPQIAQKEKSHSKNRKSKRTLKIVDEKDDRAEEANDHKEMMYDESRFNAGYPPTMLFMPCRVMLRKMMQVCASVDSYDELYFFF